MNTTTNSETPIISYTLDGSWTISESKAPNNESCYLLIPTITGRESFLNELKAFIDQNKMDRFGYIIKKDNCENSIGTKRNWLHEAADKIGAGWVAFVDDDDMINEAYFSNITKAMEGNYDCAGLVGQLSNNGVIDPRPFYHSLAYTYWWEDNAGYYRCPNHLNMVRTSIATQVKFQETNFGEDGNWSEDLAKLGLIKTEYPVTETIYYYRARTKSQEELERIQKHRK